MIAESLNRAEDELLPSDLTCAAKGCHCADSPPVRRATCVTPATMERRRPYRSAGLIVALPPRRPAARTPLNLLLRPRPAGARRTRHGHCRSRRAGQPALADRPTAPRPGPRLASAQSSTRTGTPGRGHRDMGRVMPIARSKGMQRLLGH